MVRAAARRRSGSLPRMSGLAERLPDVGALLGALDGADYLADEALGTSLFLAARMGQPIRLQCYEGLTSSEALYEWNYPRQLLAIRLAEAQGGTLRESDLFSAEYLLERPLLAALKRRCLYHWIDYPATSRVAAIIRRRVPAAAVPLAGQVAAGVARLRDLELAKPPGIAEAISWTAALHVLGAEKLDEASAEQTAGAVLKYAEDLDAARAAGLADGAALAGGGSGASEAPRVRDAFPAGGDPLAGGGSGASEVPRVRDAFPAGGD